MIIFKMPFETRCFNFNQKVEVLQMTGNMACLVRGKFRGKGKKVNAWVKWNNKDKKAPRFITIPEIEE